MRPRHRRACRQTAGAAQGFVRACGFRPREAQPEPL